MKRITMIFIMILSLTAVGEHIPSSHVQSRQHRPIPSYLHHRPHPMPHRPDKNWFWSGFLGGVIGGAVVEATRPTVVTQPIVIREPVVVSQPVQQVQTVWVEGRYIDMVGPDGKTIRTWQPGHYEQRIVTVR